MTLPPKYLLDTNVVSETRKLRPNGEVTRFLGSVPADATYISVLTIGELRKGVGAQSRLDPAGAETLSRWVDRLQHDYADHIIGVDIGISRLWGELSGERSRPIVDTLLAATALVNNFLLVTRNSKDFRDVQGLRLLNPWYEV